MENTEIYKKAIKTYGSAAQIDVLIEEMSELTKAVLKFRRIAYGTITRDKIRAAVENIAEEIADVEIMLDQSKIIYGGVETFDCNLIESYKQAKIKRLAERIKD